MRYAGSGKPRAGIPLATSSFGCGVRELRNGPFLPYSAEREGKRFPTRLITDD